MSEGSKETNISLTRAPLRRSNHAIWLGPVIVFVGVVSYFTHFSQFPGLRDFPWVNLPIVVIGFVLSFISVKRAFGRSDIFRGKIVASLSLAFSLFFTVLFVAYIGHISYQLPQPTAITQNLTLAPEFVLKNQNGQDVSSADFRGKKLIVTFYRGYW